MGHMPTAPLAELTQRAQTLSSAGDLVGARRVLAGVLDPAGADPGTADADLALAAALHARILIALGDAHGARLWATFAHEAEERLHGPRDERTVAAAATHAAVLQRVGHHGRAAQVYERLVTDLTAMDGPDSPRVLAAEADLSTAEHAAGHCTSARSRLTGAWVRHRHRHGDAAPAGIKMLARLGAMERECARDGESREHLAQAQELCARYLPADHPLVRQVAALAVAQTSGRHRCGRVQQSTGPGPAELPQGRTPTPVAPPQAANPSAVARPQAGIASPITRAHIVTPSPVTSPQGRTPTPVAPPQAANPSALAPPQGGAPNPAGPPHVAATSPVAPPQDATTWSPAAPPQAPSPIPTGPQAGTSRPSAPPTETA